MTGRDAAERQPVGATGLPARPEPARAWEFQWAQGGGDRQWAQVTGRLHWRGFAVDFALDGLSGLDGRLAAPPMGTLPQALRQLVLHHVADECLRPLEQGPLMGMGLSDLRWHEAPVPMEGEFEFTVKRMGLRGVVRGRLAFAGGAGRDRLFDAISSLGWRLPAETAAVAGRLQVGGTRLTPEEFAGLGVGDLVWLDDADLSPQGLGALFLPASPAAAPRRVRIKRRSMALAGPTAAPPAVAGVQGGCGVALVATSRELAVQRAWLQGALPAQAMREPALAMDWTFVDSAGHAGCEGRLLLVGRRLGLRLTRVVPAVEIRQVA